MIRDLFASVPAAAFRRAAGWAWTSGWCAVLYAAARPWRDLGGVVDERIRWAAWAALLASSTLGFAVGTLARRSAVATGRVTHLRVLRGVVLPAAAATATALVVLRGFGMDDVSSVATLGFLGAWAGIDLAFAAVPLMDGEAYAFARPLPPPIDREEAEDDPARDDPLL